MNDHDAVLPHGLYETPVTRRVLERLGITESLDDFVGMAIADVDGESSTRFNEAISRVIGEHLVEKLNRTNDPLQRVELINSLAALIDPDDAIEPERLLHAVYPSDLGGVPTLPPTPPTGASLLTNSGADQNMASEIKREIQSADSVDLLCAFIKNTGASVIRDQLEYLRDNDIPLRVITSTYCGASDIHAIDRLVNEFGAQVKIGYESQDTRLHAKAWLFHRKSGFDTAYIGSSNLSNSALIDGVEWNVRASKTTTPEILAKFKAVFDTYWNDKHYETYDPEFHQDRLKVSLQRERFGTSTGEQNIRLSGLQVEPWPYQESMLEALETERSVHGRHRNLLIAATGTGKTVVAALDYRRLVEQAGGSKPSLLFVAHRTQLLEQAKRTYREVLQDPNFGEILDGANTPSRGTHVFATIQSLHKNLSAFPPDRYSIVVVDEFHHAEASTYKKLLDYIEPTELLGLTATPERGDGFNVEQFFDYRVAYELRLWDALQLGLVAPLHYYGINDETDLRDVQWSRASKAYDTESLTNFYLHMGDKRVKLILNELQKRVFDLGELKALGFCVSIDHANFMAERFNALGLPSAAVTSETPRNDRARAISELQSGDLKVLFTVDLFNEGVDIPDVNTLLLLRPTQSPIIFLQQLGRGLRKRPGKVCTVLDFIGQQHENFDLERRYAAITGKTGRPLVEEIEDGFPSLPGASSIQLDPVTEKQVLSNVKKLTDNNLKRLRALVVQEKTTDLSQFLSNTFVELEDLYRNRKQGGWTRLLRSQKLLASPGVEDPNEEFLLSRVGSLLHVNDRERAEAYLRLISNDAPGYEDLNAVEQTFAQMLVTQLWANMGKANSPASWDEALQRIRSAPAFIAELEQVFTYRLNTARIKPEPIKGPGAEVLRTHADYTVGELTASLRNAPIQKMLHLPREGVYYIDEQAVDLFFVTLVKDEGRFSATTSYEDYPISRTLFQWESQSTTSLSSKAGQRYIHHEETGNFIYLCVRNTRQNSAGFANAYTLLGDVSHVSHQGEKPIRFKGGLNRPMPAALYEQGRAVI